MNNYEEFLKNPLDPSVFPWKHFIFYKDCEMNTDLIIYRIEMDLELQNQINEIFTKEEISQCIQEHSDWDDMNNDKRLETAQKYLMEFNFPNEFSMKQRKNKIDSLIKTEILFDGGFSLFYTLISGRTIIPHSSTIEINNISNTTDFEILLYLDTRWTDLRLECGNYFDENGIKYKDCYSVNIPDIGKFPTSFLTTNILYGSIKESINFNITRIAKLQKIFTQIFNELRTSKSYKNFEVLQKLCSCINQNIEVQIIRSYANLQNHIDTLDWHVYFGYEYNVSIDGDGVCIINASFLCRINNTDVGYISPVNGIMLTPTEDWMNLCPASIKERDAVFTPYELMNAFYGMHKSIYTFIQKSVNFCMDTYLGIGKKYAEVRGITASIDETSFSISDAYMRLPLMHLKTSECGITFFAVERSWYKNHSSMMVALSSKWVYVPLELLKCEYYSKYKLNEVAVARHLHLDIKAEIPEEWGDEWNDACLSFVGLRGEYAVFCVSLDTEMIGDNQQNDGISSLAIDKNKSPIDIDHNCDTDAIDINEIGNLPDLLKKIFKGGGDNEV